MSFKQIALSPIYEAIEKFSDDLVKPDENN
jgi:hypothetical protein